ncbi:MAG TPA: hypothetical protein DIW31_01390 [Bacteroidales bacterium]|nr:hypothetical protein [Bacteroidales bacterium]
MSNEEPLVNKSYRLQKIPGKGGWTYAPIPEILQDKHAYFGWVKVKGSIDGYPIKSYHLMPMGNGTLFLPVKAQIRKAIGKGEGDWVRVILFKDDAPLDIPEEFILCLNDDAAAKSTFFALHEGEQKRIIEWIYSAKKEETKINRMAKSINMLSDGKVLNS